MVSRNALRAGIVIAAALAVASCSSSAPKVAFKQRSKEYFSEKQYGTASPRVVHYGPVPKGGGHVVVGDSYSVAGKIYTPRENERYSKVGYASWYGEAFHGRLTANGEVYDVNGLTAASPTLPLPSYVRVTNLSNGRNMIVRINDRGPFAKDRIIDLSSRVADLLDVKNEGTAKVKVDYIGPARMDGLDERMLLASYQGPAQSGDTRFAWIKPKPDVAPPVVVAASAIAPLPRIRPDLAAYPPAATAAAFHAPIDIAPAYAPSDDDLLAPLILRSGFVNSYAEDATLSAAQHAVADLANAPVQNGSDLKSALAKAAARKAQSLGAAPSVGAVVQLGSFGDSENAKRVISNFSQYGRIQTSAMQSGDQTLTVVSLLVDPSIAPSDVVAAAATAGLSGAFLIH